MNFTRELHTIPQPGNAADLRERHTNPARPAVNFTPGHRRKGTHQ